MTDEQISSFSYYTFILHIMVGTHLILGISSRLEQDAWVAGVIGTAVSLILFIFYYRMYQMSGKVTVSDLHQYAYGKKIGRVITFLYGVCFWGIASTILANIVFFVQMILLPYTSFYLLVIPVCILLGYILFLRFGAFARTSIISFFIIAFVCFFLVLLAYFNGIFYIERLQPFLIHSVPMLVQGIFPDVFSIPFAEIFLLFVFLPMVSQTKGIWWKSLGVILIAGGALVFMMLITAGIIGGSLMNELNFPILKATEKITLLEFIKRLDLVTLVFFVLGTFMKLGLFIFGSFFMFKESLVKIREDVLIFVMISLLTLGLLMVLPAISYEMLSEFFRNDFPYVFIFPFAYIFPLITFGLLMVKRKKT